MKVVVFGATGMVGQGALRAAVEDLEVTEVLAVGRAAAPLRHPKVKNLAHKDFLDFSPAKDELTGYDACFYCLGVSSNGMNEPDYRRVTHDFTIAAAKVLLDANPEMTFVFVSGTGADSTEGGRTMWARVKGATENDLFRMPFKGVYALRPAYIHPMDGIRSRTKLYAALYAMAKPLYPVLRRLAPDQVTTTRKIGQAMLALARRGGPKKILENKDINALVS